MHYVYPQRLDDPCVYIKGLGRRNPITEKDQIIWFFEQQAKIKRENNWVLVKQRYYDYLMVREAYELCQYINERCTGTKEETRLVGIENVKAKKKWKEEFKKKMEKAAKIKNRSQALQVEEKEKMLLSIFKQKESELLLKCAQDDSKRRNILYFFTSDTELDFSAYVNYNKKERRFTFIQHNVNGFGTKFKI